MGVGRGSTQLTAIGHVLCALKSSNRADMVSPSGCSIKGEETSHQTQLMYYVLLGCRNCIPKKSCVIRDGIIRRIASVR